MNVIELNGTKYRWDISNGGRGLLLENKYIKRPYCRVTLESNSKIEEPEKLVERILGVLFPNKMSIGEKIDFDKVDELISIKRGQEIVRGKLICGVCGRICKSKAGLTAHNRKCNKKENKHGKR